MRTHRWTVAWILASTALAASLLGAQAVDRQDAAAGRIDAELTRLRTSLPTLQSEQLQKGAEQQLETLDKVAAEIAAGRPFWALAQMEEPYVYLETVRFSASHPEIRDGGLEALRQEADTLLARLSAAEKELFGPDVGELPAGYRAIAESVYQRVETTRKAALAFGDASGVATGLYYLGEAQALFDFAFFCRRLGTVEQKPPRVPPLAAAITALEDEVLDAYSADTAAKYGPYGPFVQVNVTIKKARALDERGYRLGALYSYLDARLRFELVGDSGDAADTAALHRQAEEWHGRLAGEDPADVDHSLGRIFWEAATSVLADEPSEDDRRRAGVIFNHVLPEYVEHIEEPTA